VVLVFELLGHRFDGGGSMAPLGVSIAFGFVLWITGLVLSIRSIVVSGRIGASRAVGPDAWPEARSGDGPERPAETLRRVALESLVDGAYGEGLAARRAAEERADDPAVRAVLDVIERDESVHAELGWDLLAHCLARDPSLAAPLLDAMAGIAHRADTALGA